jgi:hypothetical protein
VIDNLSRRGLDPRRPRLFVLDGSTGARRADRRNFGGHTPIRRRKFTRSATPSGGLHGTVRRPWHQANSTMPTRLKAHPTPSEV